MLDRADYALSDFLLFSARVYERLFELHNRALWPLHLLALAIGGVIVVLVLRPSARAARIVFILLALVWLFVAWTFFVERYATINWAALYVAPVFALQALLLMALATCSSPPLLATRANWGGILAVVVLLAALVGYPLAAPAFGRPWQAADMFAITPDPTAVATLAVLAMGRGWLFGLAAIIPILWIAVTALTLWTLGSPDFAVAPLAAVACAIAVLARRLAPQLRDGC